MVHTTRLDCAIGSAAGIDRAYRIARNHVENRKAFGRYLKDLPAMENLMDDLRVENIASSLLVFKMSSVFEEDLGRVGVPVAKFHVCKKQPNFVYECMEVLGGENRTVSLSLLAAVSNPIVQLTLREWVCGGENRTVSLSLLAATMKQICICI